MKWRMYLFVKNSSKLTTSETIIHIANVVSKLIVHTIAEDLPYLLYKGHTTILEQYSDTGSEKIIFKVDNLNDVEVKGNRVQYHENPDAIGYVGLPEDLGGGHFFINAEGDKKLNEKVVLGLFADFEIDTSKYELFSTIRFL